MFACNILISSFEPILSDVHNGLSIEFINKNIENPTRVENFEEITRSKWCKENKNMFFNALDDLSTSSLEAKMIQVASLGTENIGQDLVNSLVND